MLHATKKKSCPCLPAQQRIKIFSGEKEDHEKVSHVDVDLNSNFTVTQPKCRQTEPENISELFRQLTYIGLCVLTIPSITERILRISECMFY